MAKKETNEALEKKDKPEAKKSYVVISGTLQYKGLHQEGSIVEMPPSKAKHLIDLKVITPYVEEIHGKKD